MPSDTHPRTQNESLFSVKVLIRVCRQGLVSNFASFFIREMRLASDSVHAGLATITTSPLTDRVMWGCVRLSELPSSFFMMSSMRSLQWEYTVWGCLPPTPGLHSQTTYLVEARTAVCIHAS